MDPNEALKKIKELVGRYLSTDREEEWDDSDTAQLCELIDGLDGWLSKGGFLPEAWRRIHDEQIAKLQRKYEPKDHSEVRLSNWGKTIKQVEASRLERVLKGEVVTCGKQADGYFCTKPKDHPDEEHAALSDQPGAEPYFRWKDTDPECPVCGRISGHDSFSHGQDGDFD